MLKAAVFIIAVCLITGQFVVIVNLANELQGIGYCGGFKAVWTEIHHD